MQLDAAKRKALPAWIREGLEKMERQKQKKEEEARLAVEREEMRKKRLEEQAKQAALDPEFAAQQSKWNQVESQPPSENDDSAEEEQQQRDKPSLASVLKKLSPDEQDEAIASFCSNLYYTYL